MKPSEIEPATFRLVARCLNQLRYRVQIYGGDVLTSRTRSPYPFGSYFLGGRVRPTAGLDLRDKRRNPFPVPAIEPQFLGLFDSSTLKYQISNFHSRTVHPDIIKSFIYPTECTTRLQFTLTHCGRVMQICVFNTVKLGTSASSP